MPNRVHYQKKLDDLLACLPAAGVPSLLLHSCCGPCSSYVLEYLAPHFDIDLFYYNPNIIPEAEYQKRLDTQKQLLKAMPFARPVKLIEGGYEPERFLAAVRGLEDEPEGGRRCAVCFRLRLDETARTAKALGCAYFSTTLSVSPHKNADTLAEIAAQISRERGIEALPADFKKRGGYQRSIALAREYGLYRQNSCGCPYSGRTES
ncbi:MAG: epoxyqueuosine reductase QueH [Oscillospiraceae bacterium]|jgi:predicted adenine nucleotide alpha hydrolase (AANH) superfamily ATPase|nr:epoxyqueuosine reductase QueH [Oscillospiraceae bacterium]